MLNGLNVTNIIHLFKKYASLLFLIIIILTFAILEGQAQTTCNGSSGTPIFFENFGTPTTCFSNTALPLGTTTYTFKGTNTDNNPPNDGEYSLFCGSTAPWWNWGLWHQTYFDHTTGTGTGTGSNMLIVNASFTSGEFYRRAVSGLCPNTKYTFSIYVANMADLDVESSICGGGSIKPDLAFNIFNSGTTTLLANSNTGPISASSNMTWNYFDFSFTTNAGQTSVDVVLQNLAGGGCGNDLALDDIAVRACGPNLNFTVLPSKNVNSGANVTLDGTIGAGFSNPVFQWQSSSDSLNWSDVAGATTVDYIINNVTATDAKYYRLLSAETGNINNVNCRIVSNAIKLNVTTPLPLNFNILLANYVSENEVELIWSAQCHDSSTFEIFGSENGITFVSLTKIPCNKSNHYEFRYAFGDSEPMSYFKIKEYKPNQYANWSNVAIAQNNLKGNINLSIYPNPLNPNEKLHILSKFQILKIELLNIDGKLIHFNTIEGENSIDFVIPNLTKGMYLVKIYSDEGIDIEKIYLE